MNILLIVTGSISAYKAVDLANSFRKRGHIIKIVLTEAAKKFITKLAFSGQRFDVYDDDDEWSHKNGVLHIELAQWADTVLVAPATLNTIAKYSSLITDNLALSVMNAYKGLIYIAPAMNTVMYENGLPIIESLHKRNTFVIPPQEKLLACGDTGIGGLAEKSLIINTVLSPAPPIKMNFVGITNNNDSYNELQSNELELPSSAHCGGFEYQRKHHTHEGIDLYCPEKTPVYACESGTINSIDWFTGVEANSPWWNSTKYISVQHDTLLVTLYGEIEPINKLFVGQRVKKGQLLGFVKQVLKINKGRPMSMLHFEQYHTWLGEPFCWEKEIKNNVLKNPFNYLFESYNNSKMGG